MGQPHAETTDPKIAGAQPPFPQQAHERVNKESEMKPRPDFGQTSYHGHGRLAGRIALITGADSGIGRAVALAYAREGADVAIAYLKEHEDAQETAQWIKDAGRKCLLLAGDIADEKHVQDIIQETNRQFGRIDILVNNAAVQEKAVESIEQMTTERIERTFRVNIIAMFHLVRHALPHMRPGSTIINVASIQAYQPGPSILDYASTKGAIVTFTKGLAQELIKRGIRVNAVAPGPVWTPLVTQSFDQEKLQHFGENSPMERPAQPAELAPAFVFLASDEARYVNGEILGVTGGRLLA
jgi:NAD(P)-dependent dehydrogenase (short-subunit alcohol dehydrogenase family)